MTNYVLNEEKMFADVADGVAIIINSETGVYYGMNTFGTMIYENLLNGVSSEQILSEISSWDDSIVENYNNFIKFMTDNEILIVSSNVNSSAQVNLNKEIALNDGLIPEAKEYRDAQELLLADPIHEVKEEKGWAPEKSALNEDKEDVARREAKMHQ